MRRNFPFTPEELARRYPRLMRSMRWVACLTYTEAAHCLYMRKHGDDWAGEAVNHYGGCEAVMRSAFQVRHIVRRFHARRFQQGGVYVNRQG